MLTMKMYSEQVQQRAREIYKVSFLFPSLEDMRLAVGQARDKEVRRYRDSQKADGVDYNTRSKTYASCPSLIAMIDRPSGLDRVNDDPVWIQSVSAITKRDMIDMIERLIAGREGEQALQNGFIIAVDAQLYYYEAANDRLLGIPAEPTGEYYSLDILKYTPNTIDKEITPGNEPETLSPEETAYFRIVDNPDVDPDALVLKVNQDQLCTLAELVRTQLEYYRRFLQDEGEYWWQQSIIGLITHHRNLLQTINTL
jgi:hypothetical protein